MKNRYIALGLLLYFLVPSLPSMAQAVQGISPQKVIFDTDIGDDIDDAFALGLLLRSPELKILGVTTAWGDTELRARLVKRFLVAAGKGDIPIAVGVPTHTAANAPFTQAQWASREPQPVKPWPNATDFILSQIHKYPGEITLISIAPLSNIGALIDRDPESFHKLKQVIIMGGSIRKGYGDLGYRPDHGPDPEYNILLDISSAKKLFNSGVPLTVLPLDSTQLKLDEVKRTAIFSADNALTTAITTLYEQWTLSTNNPTPTLFDVLAVSEALEPSSCPTQLISLQVDDRGFTREVSQSSQRTTIRACLQASADKVFHLLISRLISEKN